jgi:hypothetical protein
MAMQLTESVNTALGGVSPPSVITTHRGWSHLSSWLSAKLLPQLSNAAKALEKDQTKEQAGRLIQWHTH